MPLVLLTFLLPESPRSVISSDLALGAFHTEAKLTRRWLMIKGRQEEALHTLARLHARGNVNDPVVVGEFHAIKTQMEELSALDQGWGQVSYSQPDSVQER